MTALWPLERYVRRAAASADAQTRPAQCELCGSALTDAHRHAVDVESQRLLCVCRGCGLLFSHPGTSTGNYRSVPERIAFDPDFSLSEQAWAATEVPVRLAFVFKSSKLDRWIAIYPSAAGPTESALALDAWADIAAQSPLVQSMAPDVEALLVYGPRPGEPLACLLVPIDICYELVAEVRQSWKGLGGGDALDRIAHRFRALRHRARPLSSRKEPSA